MRHIGTSDCNMLRRSNEIYFFFWLSRITGTRVALIFFIILFGGVVVLIDNTHVRVDLIFNSSLYTEKTRELVNCIGNIIFLIPFCIIIIWASYPFIYDSLVYSEKSPDPGGLSNRWIVKSFILTTFGLTAGVGVAQTIKSIKKFCKKDD